MKAEEVFLDDCLDLGVEKEEKGKFASVY